MSEHVVSLTSLNQGAAIEMFDTEIKKVVENIADLNTPAKAKREITLKVTFLPDEERKQGAVAIVVTCKLPGHRGSSTTVWFGRKNGERFAVESDPSPGLFDQGRKLNMVPLTDKEAK
jgi:hypothetical protein